MRNLALVLTSAFFFSCETDTDIGLGLDNKGVFFSDTIQVSSATYLMDSVITSNQNFAVIGRATDPFFGEVSSIAYLQPTLETSVLAQSGFTDFDITEAYTADSLVIRLWNRNLIYYGDTLSTTTYNIHRLSSPLTGRNYGNNDDVAYEPEILASIDFNIQNLQRDSSIVPITAKLPASIIEELFAIEGTDDAKDLTSFQDKFGGFAIVPSSNSKAIYSFNVGTQEQGTTAPPVSSMLYYFHFEGDTTARFYNFEFKGRRFNQTTTDLSATEIAGLTQPKQQVSSTLSNDNLYVQAGTGLGALLKFPGIQSLKNSINVAKAEIVFEVDSLTFSDNFSLAPLLVPLEVNADGSVKRDNILGYSYIGQTLNTIAGNLGVYDDSLSTISVDVTPYVRDIVLKNSPDNGVLITAASLLPNSSSNSQGIVFNAGLNRVILRKPKIRLYYSR